MSTLAFVSDQHFINRILEHLGYGSYAYSYGRILCELYLVDGLR
jgi:hypothetical protein